MAERGHNILQPMKTQTYRGKLVEIKDNMSSVIPKNPANAMFLQGDIKVTAMREQSLSGNVRPL